MQINWTPASSADLANIEEYIAEDSPKNAVRVITTIFHTVTDRLPLRTGRPGRVEGTYELVIPRLPYIVVYRIKPDHFDILRVYHTSRMWPEEF